MDKPTDHAEFLADMEDLSSAEEFLEYFAVPYDAKTVHVNRLHILQRCHEYLARHATPDSPASFDHYRRWLQTAYADFVNSDARTEKVFRVFRMHEPQTTFVPLSEIFR